MKDPTARRVARVVFGIVLLVGAVRIVSGVSRDSTGSSLVPLFQWTWLTALGAALVAYFVASWLPPVRKSDVLLRASLVVPAVGCAFMLPLSVQLAYGGLAHVSGGFDEWVRLSIIFTGFAHGVFALMMGIRAQQLAEGRKPISVRAIYLGCVLAGNVPFPVLPPLYIAITGLPILPIIFAMQPLAAWERRAEPVLPLAIAKAA